MSRELKYCMTALSLFSIFYAVLSTSLLVAKYLTSSD